MFKYLKTLNSDNHPSAIESYRAPQGSSRNYAINAGSIVSIMYGEILESYDCSLPMYLAITAKANNEVKDIKCIRISTGMVFEVDFDPSLDTSSIYVGAIGDAGPDDTGKGVFFTTEGSTRFEVLDTSNFNSGKITIVAI